MIEMDLKRAFAIASVPQLEMYKALQKNELAENSFYSPIKADDQEKTNLYLNKSSDRIKSSEKGSFNEIFEKLDTSDFKIDQPLNESAYVSDTDAS